MTDFAELDNIESAFAALVFGHEGLRTSEPLSQTNLG